MESHLKQECSLFTPKTEHDDRQSHSSIRPVALLQLQHYHHTNHAYSSQPRWTNPHDYRRNSSLTRHSLPIAQSATNPKGDRRTATGQRQRQTARAEADGEGRDAPDIRLQKASHQSPSGAPTAAAAIAAAAAFFSAAAMRRRLAPRPRIGGMARNREERAGGARARACTGRKSRRSPGGHGRLGEAAGAWG